MLATTLLKRHPERDQTVSRALDWHFARFITGLAGSEDAALFLAAALVSQQTRQGHVCADLPTVAGRPLQPTPGEGETLQYPELETWRRSLEKSRVVGSPGEYRPLILDHRSRLYLYRYWEYEKDLVTFIRERAAAVSECVDGASLERGLARYFRRGRRDEHQIDWQELAARTAITRRFCVITGGPGTGKTTTIAKVLALLREQPQGTHLRIALAAPTGKAAARMEEAIRTALDRLECPSEIKATIPTGASTLHRLLGTLPDSPYFRHHARNPLAVDVVIVDEASMVDLALMAKLVRALPPHAGLILLGDKDQLASVEAGAVLGDICDRGEGPAAVQSADFAAPSEVPARIGLAAAASDSGREPALAASIVELRDSFRFQEGSGIGRISRGIRSGDGAAVLATLHDDACADLSWAPIPSPGELTDALSPIVIRGFSGFFQAPTVEQRFAAFEHFRILCALRHGPFGVEAVNALVERILLEEQLIPPGQWYSGRPLMITQNDYNLKLFNGDIGIVLPEDYPFTPSAMAASSPEGGKESGLRAYPLTPAKGGRPLGEGSETAAPAGYLRVFFPSAGGSPRKFLPARLPPHETVYAMTVHKSQGSEFDEVLLLLPDRDSPVLTRELLYTGVTRARRKVGVWGREDVTRTAVARRVQRSSGLRDALWGPSDPVP